MTVTVDILQRLPLLSALPRVTLSELSKVSDFKTFSKREVVVNKGAEPQHLLFLLDGRLQGVDFTVDGKEVGVFFTQPGEFFGEMSLFTGAPRSATIIAASHSVVLEINKLTVASLFDYNPSFSKKIADIIDARVAENAKKSSAVSVASTEERPSIFNSIKAFFKLTFS
jgi:CRP-like cAMP-binding protein